MIIKTYAEVAHELMHATSAEKLLEASKLIQHVADLDHRDELAVLYKRVAEDFKTPKEREAHHV